MQRTTVVFPAGLKKLAMARARQRKISFSELVREAVEREMGVFGSKIRRLTKEELKKDPFWSDVAKYRGPVPPDLSINHDKYLYDEPES